LEVRPADPNLFIEAAVESVRPAAEAKCSTAKIVDTGIVTVPGDRFWLQQVVWNLIKCNQIYRARGRVQVRLDE
jgi:signal transduction histidine kinase